jgi:hypothetical protein
MLRLIRSCFNRIDPTAGDIPMSNRPRARNVSRLSTNIAVPESANTSRQHVGQAFEVQKKADQLTASRLADAIHEEIVFLSDQKPSRKLAGLLSESTSVRDQVLLRLVQSDPYALISRFSELKLRCDQSDLALRKNIARASATSEYSFKRLASKIGEFHFTAQDLPFLAEIGRMQLQTGALPFFVKSLRAWPIGLEFPTDVQAEFARATANRKPFPLGELGWGNENHAESISTITCEWVLGVKNIFESSVVPVPATITRVLGALNAVQPDRPHEEEKNWLSFCALILHGKVHAGNADAVENLLRYLGSQEDAQLRYHHVQLMAKILSEPECAALFEENLPKFDDPRFLTVVLGALTDSEDPRLAELITRLATITGAMPPRVEQDRHNFNACLLIAQDETVPVEEKFRLLDLCIGSNQEIKAEDVVANLYKLGKIFDEISKDHGSYIGQALNEWLPHCQTLVDLNAAAAHGPEFVKKMLVFLLNKGFYLAREYLRQVGSEYYPSFSDLQFAQTTLTADELTACIDEVREQALHGGNGSRILKIMQNAVAVHPTLLSGNLRRLEGRHPIIDENMRDEEVDYDDEPEDPALISKAELARIAAFTLAGVPAMAVHCKQVNELLKAIFDLQAPDVSRSLMLGLAQVLRRPDQMQQLEAFIEQHRKPHMKALLIPLAALCAPESELGQALSKAFKRDEFKDIRRLTPALIALNLLAFDPSLSGTRREQLLRMCLGDGNDGARSLMTGLSFVQCLAQMASLKTAIGKRCAHHLQHADTLEAVHTAVKEEIRNIFPLSEAESTQFATRLDDFLSSHRRPAALLSYVTSMSAGLKGVEYEALMNELTIYVRTAILPTDAEVFRVERYDLAKSSHLAQLAASAPQAMQGWKAESILPSAETARDGSGSAATKIDLQSHLITAFADENHVAAGRYPKVREVLRGNLSASSALQELGAKVSPPEGDIQHEVELLTILVSTDPEVQARLLGALAKKIVHTQFKIDLRALKALVSPQDVKSGQVLQIVDSDNPEDLFLSGTEIVGSCQSVYGDAKLSRALMGYVLDGKYRLLAVKDESGRIVARRMMRLMISESDEGQIRPVIQLERLYANPGISQAAIDKMLKLVSLKAKSMNADVMSCEDDLPVEGEGHTLISKATERPYEYVDANFDIENNGDFSVAGAKRVSLPD